MLDLLRAVSFLIWAANFVCLLPAWLRVQQGVARERDGWWAQSWLSSALLSAWGLRNVTAGPTFVGSTYSVTCGLQVLTVLVGVSLALRRFRYEGWRL